MDLQNTTSKRIESILAKYLGESVWNKCVLTLRLSGSQNGNDKNKNLGGMLHKTTTTTTLLFDGSSREECYSIKEVHTRDGEMANKNQ